MRPFLDKASELNGGRGAFAPPFSDHSRARVLAAGVAETLAVPDGAGFVNIWASAQADLYVREGAAASVPAADSDDGNASAGGLGTRRLQPGTSRTLGIVSPTACVVTAEFWK